MTEDAQPQPEPLLVRRKDVCRLLGISTRTVYDLVRIGALTPVYVTENRGWASFRLADVRRLAETGVADREGGGAA